MAACAERETESEEWVEALIGDAFATDLGSSSEVNPE